MSAVKPAILRVWGNADSYELQYTRGADGRWRASVPPDMGDGQYAVEIHALDEAGYEGCWTGILYMRQGRVCIRLNSPRYCVRVRAGMIQAALQPDGRLVRLTQAGAYGAELQPERVTIELSEVCYRGRAVV